MGFLNPYSLSDDLRAIEKIEKEVIPGRTHEQNIFTG